MWRNSLRTITFCMLAGMNQLCPAFAAETNIMPDIIADPAVPKPGTGTADQNSIARIHLGGYNLYLFPSGDFYRPYAADPHRTGFGIQKMHVTDGSIPDSGSSRYALRAGGYFGVMRLQPAENADVGIQLNIGGGMDGQYDMDHFQDNIGWNGHYGMILTAAADPALSFKIGVQHISGHVGDENVPSTKRGRIGYTRMELNSGVSWSINRNWRTYAEGGWGYELLNRQLQKPGRVQYGAEYEYLLWKNIGCYTAVDFSAMQELAWRVDKTMQFGLVSHSGHRTWRFGFEVSKGRPTLSEFFQNRETYTSFGLWLDL